MSAISWKCPLRSTNLLCHITTEFETENMSACIFSNHKVGFICWLCFVVMCHFTFMKLLAVLPHCPHLKRCYHLSLHLTQLLAVPTRHPPRPPSVQMWDINHPPSPLRAFQPCSLLSQDFISPAPEEVRILKLVWSANPLLVLSPIAPPKTNTGGAPHLIPRMVTPNECLIRTLSEPEDACPDIWTILTQHHL